MCIYLNLSALCLSAVKGVDETGLNRNLLEWAFLGLNLSSGTVTNNLSSFLIGLLLRELSGLLLYIYIYI